MTKILQVIQKNKIINLGIMMKDYENGEEQSRYIDSNFFKHMTCIKVYSYFSPKINGYVIYGDNKQRSLDQQAQQVISNDTNRSLVFD